MEPVGALLPLMCAPGGRVLLADPTARTRHNRYRATIRALVVCSGRRLLWSLEHLGLHACAGLSEASVVRRDTVCGFVMAREVARREYFVDLLLSDRQHPMLLEECSSVAEEMDGQAHPVEIMQLRFREGRETVGVKVLHR